MNFKICSLFLLLIVLQSCACIKLKLTKDERAWCSYSNDEILIYKSNKGNIDTLKVSDRYESYSNEDCNFIEVSRKQINSLSVNLSLESKTKTVLASNVSITKDYNGETSFPELSFFGLTSNLNFGRFVENKVRLSTTRKTYHKVHLIKDGLNARNIENGYLESFYYDQKDGLIKYVTKYGEQFELLKRQ